MIIFLNKNDFKKQKFKIPKQLSKLFEYIRNISGYIFLFQLLITLTL